TLQVGEFGVYGLGPDTGLPVLDLDNNVFRYPMPVFHQHAMDTKTLVSDDHCAAWLYKTIWSGMNSYNVERVMGIGLIERLSRLNPSAPVLPNWDTSLHIPEARGQNDRIIDSRISVACSDDPVNEQSAYRDDLPFGRWSVFYDQLYFLIAGENAEVARRMEMSMLVLRTAPLLYEATAGVAAPRRGVVVAFHQVLQGFHDEGLTHYYPEVIARFLDPNRPGLAGLPVFDRQPFSVLEVGETLDFEGEVVAPLATNAYELALGPSRSPDISRRLVVDVTVPADRKDSAEDLHIIVNGEVFSDVLQIAGESEDATVRAVITIDDAEIDRALIGVAQVPQEISAETADGSLSRLGYDLSITLEEVELCDITLFSQFTNPRLARASGNIGPDGSAQLPWLARDLGPRTSATINLASPERAVTEAIVCVDHLMATDAGQPVISFYTPNPLSQIGGGFGALSVEHEGWGGWLPNATFKLFILLPDITLDELRAGRTYRAVLPGMMGGGFSAIYSDYQGRFTGPGPGDLEGVSNVMVSKGVRGMFAVTDVEAGFLRGQLTMSGPTEFITWEHNKLDDGQYQMISSQVQTNLSISGEIAIEATRDNLRFVREGGSIGSAVIE
ncbi:MAG: hypothetical protein KJP02_00760, partial [Octadecabacter sp.]|nr:hypothetical protein [Octadecabacter sp.]